MPDSDAPSRIDSSRSDSFPERVNLPVVVPQPQPERGEGWITRLMRAGFNWYSSSARSDLQPALEAPLPYAARRVGVGRGVFAVRNLEGVAQLQLPGGRLLLAHDHAKQCG